MRAMRFSSALLLCLPFVHAGTLQAAEEDASAIAAQEAKSILLKSIQAAYAANNDDIAVIERRKPAGPVHFVSRSDDELVLLELRAGRSTLRDSVPGYATKSGLLLPLSPLMEAVQFPIKIFQREGQAEGWFLQRSNHFSLDATRGEVILHGETKTYPAQQVEAHEDDIYVDTALLSQWFPLTFDFNFSTQSVSIGTQGNVLLPFQSEAKRAELRAGLDNHKDDEIPLPRVQTPYTLFTLPFADVTYTGGYDSNNPEKLRNDVTVQANGDAFYMHSEFFLAADQQDNVRDLRWTLSRRDPDGQLFKEAALKGNRLADGANALELRELALGDVYTQQVPLSAFNQQGRGFLISSKPYDMATQFDRTTLQGNLEPGWEVELYRNDELLDFRRASADGRYEFIDVPLVSGLNILRLVFYGPFGQTREEVQRLLVSGNITSAGKSYFRVSLTQQDTSILDLRDENSIGVTGIAPQERELAKGEARLLAEYEYGLTQNVALFTNVSHLTLGDAREHTYIGGGIGTSLLGSYMRLDGSHDAEDGGNALQLALQDNWWGISVSAQHRQYYDFISEFTESMDDPIIAHTILRADTPLNVAFLPRMNTGISGERVRYDSGRVRDELSQRLSASISRVALSHTLSLRDDNPATGDSLRQTRGELVANVPFSALMLRGNIAYNVTPERDIDGVALAAEYHVDLDTIARVDVSRQMNETELTTTTLALNRRFEHFLLGASAGHASDGNNTVGITLSFGLGQDPRSQSLQAYPDYVARDGMVIARAYEDANNNATFDAGDSVLEHAQFRVNRGMSPGDVNDHGIALLRGIAPDTPVRVTLEDSSIDNPYLYAPRPGAEVVARSGSPVFVDVPLVATSDVEGTCYITDASGGKKPAANVRLEIVDAKGTVVKDTRSAFDGYYLIDRVPLGQYRLRVSQEQLMRLSLVADDDKTVSVTGHGQDSIGPLDFVLRHK